MNRMEVLTTLNGGTDTESSRSAQTEPSEPFKISDPLGDDNDD